MECAFPGLLLTTARQLLELCQAETTHAAQGYVLLVATVLSHAAGRNTAFAMAMCFVI